MTPQCQEESFSAGELPDTFEVIKKAPVTQTCLITKVCGRAFPNTQNLELELDDVYQ